MIYIGNNEISNIYVGTDEIYGIYAGDLQIYPTDFGIVTAISLENLVWVKDVSANGGTADSGNCSFKVYAYYDSGKRKNVTRDATVSGSLVVSSTTADTREMVGTLTLTATYSGFTATGSVDVYQKAQTYNNMLIYTTTDGNALNRDFSQYAWAQNYVSHTYSGGTGRIIFDDDLTTIPQSTFSGCTTLQTISIPISVTSYGASAFTECCGMTEFTISSAITSIGAACFKLTSGVLTINDCQYAVQGGGRETSYHDGGDAFKYSFAGKFCGSTYKNYNGINFDKIIVTGSTTMYIGSAAFHASPATEMVFGENVNFFGGMSIARMNNEEYGTILKPFQYLTIANTGSTTFGTYFGFYGVDQLKDIKYYPSNNLSMNSNYFSVPNGVVHYKQGSTGRVTGLPSVWTTVYDL